METKDINELRADPKNPRRIDKSEYESLKRAMMKFGDLSGIVLNQRTGELVGGHMRVRVFKESGGQPIITERLPQANSVGTVAIGYVLIGDEKWTYREVDWDIGFQKSANVAANRHGGNWDLDLLAQSNYELSQFDNGAELLELTGQSDEELKRLNKMIGVEDGQPEDDEPKPDEPETLSFSLTAEQRELVEEAIGHIKATREMAAEQNSSLNGNALYYMSRDYLDRLHNQAPTAPVANDNPPAIP